MPRRTLALTALLLALPTSSLLAQPTSTRLSPHVDVSRRTSPVEAWHDHSSTALEGALRGEAAWIAAFGDFLVDESQAAYIWEHTESMHLDNKLKKTTVALARKRLLASYREYQRELRRGRKEEAKRLWDKKYVELAQTYQLDEYQINWTTGTIYWPAIASSPRYAKHRQDIGTLIEQVVCCGTQNEPVSRNRIARACESFRKQLRADAKEAHPSTRIEYLAMQRFLVGLKYTPYLPAESIPVNHLAMK